MHRIVLACLAALLACVTASAADVFMTRDAQGRPIYTDRPESLPAEKLNVATQQTDVVEVQSRYQAEMTKLQESDKVTVWPSNTFLHLPLLLTGCPLAQEFAIVMVK